MLIWARLSTEYVLNTSCITFSPQMSQNMQLTLANKSETTLFLFYCKTRDRQITTALLVALFISINKRSNLHKESNVGKFQQRRTKHASSNDMDFHCGICLGENVSLSCLGAFISSLILSVKVLNPFSCHQIVTGRKGFPRVAEQTAAWGTKSWQKPGESCCGKAGRGKG